MAGKKNTLCLSQKVAAIEDYKRKVSIKDLLIKYKCGKTQIYNVIRDKDKIMTEWLAGASGHRKRNLKQTGNEKINELTWEWYVNARAKGLPVSGPMLKTQALEVADELGIENFTASNGWLDSFTKRHQITWNQVCGEAADINQQTVDEWKQKLASLTEGYAPQDIYNGDETGLFFRMIPSKTFSQKGEKCIGGKMSKERLTVFLCANIIGEFERPVVIGKWEKPRCFKRLDRDSLPVTWKFNKTAWMTADYGRVAPSI